MKAIERSRDRLFIDFCEFSARQLHSGDIDPAYPVIRSYLSIIGASLPIRIRFLLIYVGVYNIQTASQLLINFPEDMTKLKTGIERRGFRGNSLFLEYWNSLNLEKIFEAVHIGNWEAIQRVFLEAKHTGSWSSYKFADLCKNVLDCKIEAPDLGLGGKGKNAGPIPGLSLLTGKSWIMCATDMMLQKKFYQKCLDYGVKFKGLEEMETCLCDFNSMFKGGYYTGHDIDKQWEDLQGASEQWWTARRISFGSQYLGELSGWTGVRKELKTQYRDEGVI